MLFHSTKFDGSLHYRFEVERVHEAPNLLVTYRSPGVPMESYRGSWASRYHLLLLHWTDRHWNLCIHWHADWSPKEHYVNIATPACWADGVLRLSDLDLDLILPNGANEPRLDDADEFERHRKQLAYPDDLVNICWRTVDDVRDQMRRGLPPFDGALFAWRPGLALPGL